MRQLALLALTVLLSGCVPSGSSSFNPFAVRSTGSVTLNVGKTSFVRVEFSSAESERLVPQPAVAFVRYAQSLPIQGASSAWYSVSEFSFESGAVPGGWSVSVADGGIGFDVTGSASAAGSTVQATATVRARAALTLAVSVPSSATLEPSYTISGTVRSRGGAAVPVNLSANLALSTR